MKKSTSSLSCTFLLLALLVLPACTPQSSSTSDKNPLTDCATDSVTTNPCVVNSSGKLVTSTFGSDITSWSNTGGSTTVSAAIPNGFYINKNVEFTEPNLLAANILTGVSIFGVTGDSSGAGSFSSNALRDPSVIPIARHLDVQSTSTAITLSAETTTYAGTDLPSGFREIPDQIKDDEGYMGISCKYAPRPSADCGTSQATIEERFTDCATNNPTSSSWDGSTQCSGGAGLWKLVVRNGSNKEVWRDERTKLLWSSRVITAVNWCRASGNTQMAPVTYRNAFNNTVGNPTVGNGTISNIMGGSSSEDGVITITFTDAENFTVTGANCDGGSPLTLGAAQGSQSNYSKANFCSFTLTQGSTAFAANDKINLTSTAAATYNCESGALQTTPPTSYCAEGAAFDQTPVAGEDWDNNTYLSAKGGLGRGSTPAVAWRLPSINDYKLADVNGIRFVIPDMGLQGTNRPDNDTSQGATTSEWAASVYSGNRAASWTFNSMNGGLSAGNRHASNTVRCVGR